ncbi:hypothetical protein [Brevibacillus choshinensis]|uniref:Uncharacterized protein n=1 Tax=Brevibacillus choshinensis TaxID=54911 RepID=A0ABX7FL20_BRECH|nr:hypothetical protein [Brevibacillus choshinensis]QRG66949.1 hypothetical protein JNE38_26305 [Brevibacillus choshinensis]
MAKRRTKAQIEQERIAREQKRAEALRKWEEKEREKAEKLRRQKAEAKQREWLRTQRSRPRIEIPTSYPGESIFVHQKIHDKLMKDRGIFITSYRVEGGTGGKLILEYTTAAGGKGSVELLDLGQMPV